MISRELRRAIVRAVAAAGYQQAADPGLRPTGAPGQYAASIALAFGAGSRPAASSLAGTLAQEPWIAAADVTGPGYLTITVTREALAAVAQSVVNAGPACVTSDALAGQTVPPAPQGDPLAARTWEGARSALAARLTARLATAAGALVAEIPNAERVLVSRHPSTESGTGVSRTRYEEHRAETDDVPQLPGPASPTDLARAVAFAGRDAVTFTLARAIPGKPFGAGPEIIARHIIANPAYAVRYAHARAASGLRWAAASSSADTIRVAEASVLLDALSWLPERVATAARRGRPDEFARYLEDLASVTVDVLSSASGPANAAVPGSDKLTLAMAARTALAAGLRLLEVSAPDRL